MTEEGDSHIAVDGIVGKRRAWIGKAGERRLRQRLRDRLTLADLWAEGLSWASARLQPAMASKKITAKTGNRSIMPSFSSTEG